MSTEPNIKNRVTGAIVLVALAVIFLPLILDGQKKNQILKSQIPEKPIKGEIILVNVDDLGSSMASSSNKKNNPSQEKAPVTKKPGFEVQKQQQTNKTEADKIATQKTETNSRTNIKSALPEIKTTKPDVVVSKPEEVRRDRPDYKSAAFVIQLGSFGNKTNANKLVSRLKKAGYKAYLSVGKSNGKPIHRVLVGPILKRNQAESKIAALAKLSGLNPMIVTYDPLRH